MSTILWVVLSIFAILIISTVVIVLTYESVKKFIPVDCDDDVILESLYNRGSVKNFQKNYPEYYFENQGQRYFLTAQCQYWFSDTDGMKQQNLWIVFDAKRSYFVSESRLCFDNNDEEPVNIDTSNFSDFTQKNCK